MIHRYALLLALISLGCTSQHVVGENDGDSEPACVPSPETCDGIDNDCNGEVDDGVPGTGIGCDTGLLDACAQGETACVGGAFACVPLEQTDEICDGIDNDCDGLVDEDTTWLPHDEGIRGGSVSDVAFDPRADGVAYALVGSRVFRSTDGGASFTLAGEAPHVSRQLAFPGSSPDVLLAASDAGLLRSDDAGRSWTVIALGGMQLLSLLSHPADPARIFVGTMGAGIHRSTNGGESFVPVNGGVPYSHIMRLSGDPSDSDTVVATIQVLNPQGALTGEGRILRTVDGGSSWSDALAGAGRLFGLSRCDQESTMIAGAVGGLVRSTDGGASWSEGGLAGKWVHDVSFSASSCSTVFASVYQEGVYRSDDGGTSFVGPFVAGMDIQHAGTLVLATGDARVMGANHSGVFGSIDDGESWQRIGDIRAPWVRALAVSPATPGTLWLATWGQGIWQRSSAGEVWSKLSAAALPRDWAFTIAPDPNDGQRIFVGAWSDLWRSTDGGQSFEVTSIASNPFAVAYHPTDPLRVYAVTQLDGVHVSDDGGVTWSAFNDGLPPPWGNLVTQDVRDVLVDPNDPDTVYIATAGKGLFRSQAESPWQAVEPALAAEMTGCLVAREGSLFTCVEGEGIWASSDGLSFAPVTQGNPELSNVSDLLVDELTGAIYATSDAGVFRTDDGLVWSGLDNQCLPAPAAGEPAIVEQDGARTLVVAGPSGVLAHALP